DLRPAARTPSSRMSHEAPRSDSAPPAGPPRLARAVAAVGCLAWGWLLAITLAGALGFDVRRHHLEAAGLTFGAALVLLALARARELGPSRAWDSAGRAVPLAAAVAAALPVLWSLDLGLLSDDFGLRAWAGAGTLLPDGWPFVRPLPLMIWRGID